MQNLFCTTRLPLATFIHASNRLTLASCELARAGKVEFVFTDPEHTGEDAELAFENGECVPAKSLFASQTYLRRRMTEALNRKDENRNHEDAYHHRS